MKNRGLVTFLGIVLVGIIVWITIWGVPVYKTLWGNYTPPTSEQIQSENSENITTWDPIIDNYKIGEKAQESINSLRNTNNSIEMNNISRKYGNVDQKTVESLKTHQKELSNELVDITIDLYSDVNFNDLRKDSTIVIDDIVYNISIELKPHITLNGEKLDIRWRILK